MFLMNNESNYLWALNSEIVAVKCFQKLGQSHNPHSRKKSLSYMYLLITCSAFHHSEWFALVKGKCSELEHKKLFTTVSFCNQFSL